MIKLGSNSIGKIYLGSDSVVKAYLGNDLVYYEGNIPSILPEGYTRLQYIENPLGESAYFDSEVTLSTNFRFQIDFMSYDEITDDCVIIGGMYDTNTRRVHLATGVPVTGYSGSLMLGSSSYRVNAHLPAKETRFTAKLSATSFSIGENVEPVTWGDTGNYKVYVFALNRRNTTAPQKNSHGRLYNLKIFNGSTAVRNYIPCLNASNRVGVYDTINATFKQSAADAFVAGPVFGE